jgi:hypothetical protein
MGRHETPRMADSFGVPTYYVTDVVKEDAGCGNIRMMNCQIRNGILIPQCEVIVPASRLLPIVSEASAFVRDIFCREQALLMPGNAH